MACTAERWKWQYRCAVSSESRRKQANRSSPLPLPSPFYREAVENVVQFNGQLMRERRARLPFLDVQTGLAQSDCHLFRSRLERRRGVLPGQIYSYPMRRWKMETRPVDARAPKGEAG